MDDLTGLVVIVLMFLAVLALGHDWKRTRDGMKRRADATKRDRDRQIEEARQQWAYRVEAHALTCERCGGVAHPVPDTRDRYACGSCNYRFVGAKHSTPRPPT